MPKLTKCAAISFWRRQLVDGPGQIAVTKAINSNNNINNNKHNNNNRRNNASDRATTFRHQIHFNNDDVLNESHHNYNLAHEIVVKIN